MWSRIPELFDKTWWGPIIAFTLLFVSFYMLIWGAIEPLSLSDDLSLELPIWLTQRAIIHISAALVLSSIGITGIVSFKAWGRKSVPANVSKSVEFRTCLNTLILLVSDVSDQSALVRIAHSLGVYEKFLLRDVAFLAAKRVLNLDPQKAAALGGICKELFRISDDSVRQERGRFAIWQHTAQPYVTTLCPDFIDEFDLTDYFGPDVVDRRILSNT